jgi:hypothetical protein
MLKMAKLDIATLKAAFEGTETVDRLGDLLLAVRCFGGRRPMGFSHGLAVARRDHDAAVARLA